MGRQDDERPTPLPLIYTITSPKVCFTEVFPVYELKTPIQPPLCHPPHMSGAYFGKEKKNTCGLKRISKSIAFMTEYADIFVHNKNS